MSKIDPITAIWSTHQSLIGHNFEKKKVKAVASIQFMPLDAEMNDESFNQYFGTMGIDAVLVSRLVGVDQR